MSCCERPGAWALPVGLGDELLPPSNVVGPAVVVSFEPWSSPASPVRTVVVVVGPVLADCPASAAPSLPPPVGWSAGLSPPPQFRVIKNMQDATSCLMQRTVP